MLKKLREHVSNIKNSPHYTYLNNLGIGFWILLIVTFTLGFLFAFYIKGFVALVVSGYGLLGIFFLAILLELIVQPVGPDLALILGVLAGLNGLVVLAVVLTGAYIALYIAYLIGRKIGAPGIQRIVGKRTFNKINWTSGGKWFMLIGAATPVPYIPYLVGTWDFKLRDTIIYVVIPRTIRLVLVLVLTHYFGIELLHLTIGS